MQQIRVCTYDGPGAQPVIRTVPWPKIGKKAALIKVGAAALNPIDTYIRAGVYPRKPNLPYTPGTDTAGTVEAVGANVKRFKAGDRVYTSQTITGGYAELTIVEESRVHPLPSEISFQQGAALGIPYGTAFRALFQRAKVKAGETLLVHNRSFCQQLTNQSESG